jgi:hypothetical protein
MATPWHGRIRRTPASDRAVRVAEEVVRRAWACELLRRQDELDFAAQAAFEDCGAASARLAAAQRDGSPWKISTARAAARLAVDHARAAVLARDQGRRTLRAQLRRLKRRPGAGAAAAGPGSRQRRGDLAAAWSPSTLDPAVLDPAVPDWAIRDPARARRRPTLLVPRPQGRLRPWLRSLSSRFQ